jgi:hypothetical protein
MSRGKTRRRFTTTLLASLVGLGLWASAAAQTYNYELVHAFSSGQCCLFGLP